MFVASTIIIPIQNGHNGQYYLILTHQVSWELIFLQLFIVHDMLLSFISFYRIFLQCRQLHDELLLYDGSLCLLERDKYDV